MSRSVEKPESCPRNRGEILGWSILSMRAAWVCMSRLARIASVMRIARSALAFFGIRQADIGKNVAAAFLDFDSPAHVFSVRTVVEYKLFAYCQSSSMASIHNFSVRSSRSGLPAQLFAVSLLKNLQIQMDRTG